MLGCHRQAVLVLRWFIDGTRVAQLAVDHAISSSTAYRYLGEAIDVLAARAARHTHVQLDGIVIRTDRSCVVGPTGGVDLWWSGKHRPHGGNVQLVTASDGWPLWTSPVRPGREHDTTCARAHTGLLDTLTAWTDVEHAVLADLGYEGESTRLTCPIKNTRGGVLTAEQRTINALHAATRALAERGNFLLKGHSRRCTGSASAPGGLAPSPPQRWSCSTTPTTAPRDQQGSPPTGKGLL